MSCLFRNIGLESLLVIISLFNTYLYSLYRGLSKMYTSYDYEVMTRLYNNSVEHQTLRASDFNKSTD